MNINQFEEIIKHPMVRMKEEVVGCHSFTIISYMIADSDFWKLPMAKECRGITFNKFGECECAPFEKFFNVGERPETMSSLVEEQFLECYEKRDGSMITPILLENEKIVFKTKKSFYSDVANLVNSMIPEEVRAFCVYCAHYNITPIFEFTHPDTRIVLDYPENDNFTLLAIRCNKTGIYESFESMLSLVQFFPKISIIKRLNLTWNQIQESVKNDTGIEGYVLLLKDGTRVKYKTQWYLRMHRIMTEIRERDIAQAVIEETIDDMKSLLTSEGKDLNPVLDIEDNVIHELENIQYMTELMSSNKTWTIKDFALAYKNHEYFSLIMAKVRGKEPNYKDFWIRNYLPNYSLRCVYNQGF